MPNRSTLMTGRMPSAHGVIFNDRSLEWGANTWVRALRASGYRTALVGKSHLQHGMSRNAVHAVDRPGAVSNVYPPGWDELEDYERYLGDELPPMPDSFYGFDHVELAIDHGARISGHHLRWALDKGGRIENLLVPTTAEAPYRRRSDRWWQIYEPPYGPELHSTSFVTERTIAFIDEAESQSKPWVAWASFPDPHHPMTPPGEWFDRHDPADMVLPESIDDPLEGAPEYLRRTQQRSVDEQREFVTPCGATDHELVREAIAATYGMIEMIDDGVGRILAAVEAAGAADNTIVVFTSDHGDMMGEHGLLLKGFMPYNGTQRVPMVLADPRRAPGRAGGLAGSLDICATMLDLTGAEPYVGIQGTSLVPMLDDPGATVRDQLLIEDDFPEPVASAVHMPSRIRTLVTADGLKYTRNSLGEDMLFDLTADPLELSDLSAVDAGRRADAVDHLTDVLIATDDHARGTPALAF